MAYYGLIEAGGTKFVLGIARQAPMAADADAAREAILSRHTIPTTTPEETLNLAVGWLKREASRLGIGFGAIGIGSFGPLDLLPGSPTWGSITTTPKRYWANTDLVSPFAEAFGCPVGINTDVNGAALAEYRWGAGAGPEQARGALLYLTIGTGIGGGFVTEGEAGNARLLHGLSHPEMGHILMPRHSNDADFPGICPYHGACLEGLASGPAIIARWGRSLSELPADHHGPRMIAWYLAQAICSFQSVLEPSHIVLGGGVMATSGLLEQIRMDAKRAGNGYFVSDPQQAIVSPGLREDSGLLGALSLALETLAP